MKIIMRVDDFKFHESILTERLDWDCDILEKRQLQNTAKQRAVPQYDNMVFHVSKENPGVCH